MKSIAFFNNKGGVGKTTLVYHVAYMMSELGYKVIVADLDPQANLSSMFLSESLLYQKIKNEKSITKGIKPLLKGLGDIDKVHVEKINNNIGLIIGDLDLSVFEDELSKSWGECIDKKEPAFRKISSFYRILNNAAKETRANFILIDMGPNLGAMNRAALISTDFVVFPVGADLFSVQGISNVGRAMKEWREGWKERLNKNPEPALSLPEGKMRPIGYIVSQHGIKERKPVKSYLQWAQRIPSVYRTAILEKGMGTPVQIEGDENCLSLLKHYRSLIPMSMEVNKPIFGLRPADGAIGAHLQAVRQSYDDFKNLTEKIIKKVNEPMLKSVTL